METACIDLQNLVRIKRTGCCRWVRPSDGAFQHCERPQREETPMTCGGRSVLDEAIREVTAEDDE